MNAAAIVFSLGAIGLVAFTTAITWANAYARGYAAGLEAIILERKQTAEFVAAAWTADPAPTIYHLQEQWTNQGQGL
jgi:hypothetical protein